MEKVNSLLALAPVPEVPTGGPGGSAPALTGLETLFGNVVEVILGLAGIVLFIMLLIGGFKYLTSGGDPKALEEAKKTLTYAIAGIVLLALSFLILRFIQTITGANVTQFKIYQP